jgi:hypothetical protein
MESEHKIRLTSAELSNLWANYMSDSMSVCMLTYFLEKVMDTQTKPLIKKALDVSLEHIKKITEIYKKDQHPIPDGFTLEKDLNIRAKPLFGETFYLHYLKQMTRVGISSYGLSLSLAAREDIRSFYETCLTEAIKLDNDVTDLLLNKGIYVRAPFISTANNIEYVQDNSFLNDLFGKHRPLLAVEIAHLYGNVQTSALDKAIVMAFSQVAESSKVRKLMVKGSNLSDENIADLTAKMLESQLKAPMTWNDTVLNSTEAPFSDKLMMFHVSTIVSVRIADFGAGLAVSIRKDLPLMYTKLMAKVGDYSESIAKLMIENNWLEKPPQAEDHDDLARRENDR